MTTYTSLQNRAYDESFTRIPPEIAFRDRTPLINIGPKYIQSTRNLRIENFVKPVFLPNNVNTKSIISQGTGFVEKRVPVEDILLRNEWELSNTTNSKVFGGFDQWNIYNVASAENRQSDYMNFKDFTQPWSRILVNGTPSDNEWVMDSHGYWKSYK